MDPNWNKARKSKRALLEYREGLRPLSFAYDKHSQLA